MTLPAEVKAALSDPAVSLRLHGSVQDQDSDEPVRYDPSRVTSALQQTILSYVSDPPKTESGYCRWLAVLAGRQAGKSTTAALCAYAKSAYIEGWESVVIADHQERADALFERVMYNHDRWPEETRVRQRRTNETRSFTVHPDDRGGKMKVLSGAGGAVGIGRSVSFFHGSELPYWRDAEGQFSLLYPSMVNRRRAMMLLESTPAPMSEPSSEWWREMCFSAQRGKGRFLFAFFPFWDSRLCRRPWPVDQKPDLEELRLLEQFAGDGLSLENLQFRREAHEDDPYVRRRPELFGVYYPFDPVSCWMKSGSGIIPFHCIEPHTKGLLIPTKQGFHPFQEPREDALYLIACDPTGYGTHDHCAFHIFEIWSDRWIQVATFGDVIDPDVQVNLLIEKAKHYNNARIAIERNGVGDGILAALIMQGYRNIHYEKAYVPGIWKSSNEEWINVLIDGLMDQLKLYDQDTVQQLIDYRGDHLIQRSVKQELVAELASGGRRDTKRRPRHHWDKVSALMILCATAKAMPTRYFPMEKPDNVEMMPGMTWNKLEKREKRQDKRLAQRKGGKLRRKASYTRRKR